MNKIPAEHTRIRTQLALSATALALAAPLLLSGGSAEAAPATGVRTASAPAAVDASSSHRTTRTLARGLRLKTLSVKNPAATPRWTVTVQAPVKARFTGAQAWATVGPETWSDTVVAQLRAKGFEPTTARIPWPHYSDTPHGLMGVRVRVGSYPTQAAAQGVAQSVSAAGLHPAVEWTGYDADQPADVENINVAIVDPHTFDGSVAGTHDGNVAQRETTSAVAAKLGALVGVNGGFFLTSDADGVQGTQAGVSAHDGKLQSMAVGARAALILGDGGRHNRIEDLTTTVTVRSGRARYAVQGINRTPGLVRDCGRPGGLPTAEPRQDTTCTLADDLVMFTPEYVHALPAGPGTQVVLDSHDRVLSAGPRGGTVAPGSRVLQGTGAAADWLTARAKTHGKVSVTELIRDAAGRRITLGAHDSIVSAAPTLVENGRVRIDAATEGTVDPADLSFGYAWANTRQPRTMAGIDGHGRLLLVTVDGRLSGGSEGFTLSEGAGFMRSLGAVRALNLDGGGSTAMAVNGTLVNRPSDATGERAVGDTIQVLPRTR